jgi:hypothetical protein
MRLPVLFLNEPVQGLLKDGCLGAVVYFSQSLQVPQDRRVQPEGLHLLFLSHGVTPLVIRFPCMYAERIDAAGAQMRQSGMAFYVL